jgi:hypothetical protein
MKTRNALLAAVASAGFAAYALPANAAVDCPAIGIATGCNLVITFTSSSEVTTVGSSPGTYDGSDDTLIGVVNNTSSTITSFKISSTNDIFGFDGDGIDVEGPTLFPPVGTNPDTTGYGGPDGFFTNILTSGGIESGIVNFANGGIAPGGFDFFSLEEPLSVGSITVTPTVPEPASMAILGVGLLGAGIARHRRAA